VTLPAPVPGLVIRYGFLWADEHAAGLEQGRKDRPCVIVISVLKRADETTVVVAPITHQRPRDPADGLEIPAALNDKLGLDPDASWIVLNQLNRFTWPGPDLRPISRSDPERFSYGYLPSGLFRVLRDRIDAIATSRRISIVPRTD
jgi:hypothetical protein